MLLDHIDSQLPQPVRQYILVDLLKMPMPMIAMYSKARFPDQITELVDAFEFHIVSSL